MSATVDREQLAALRRLRAAFGDVQVLAVDEGGGAGGREPKWGRTSLDGRLRRSRQPVSTRRHGSLELWGETVPRLVLRRADGWWDVVPGEHCH